MKSYIEHFNELSNDYLKYRPDYPDELYEYLTTVVNAHELVWDVGTGNGQAAHKLAHYFKKVIATDKSEGQLAIAHKKSNIEYICCEADQTQLEDSSVDLITIAQALHWFPLPTFYQEVKRVLKKNGFIAAWCYSLCKVDAPVNKAIQKLYGDILMPCWPLERQYINEGYQTISFPFVKQTTPPFSIERHYDLNEFLGYLHTWSAVKEYMRQHNEVSPVTLIEQELRECWGDATQKHRIVWPIHLLLGTL